MAVSLLAGFAFAAAGCGKAEANPQIIWQTSRLGKPTELSLGPNRLFYMSSGNKLTALDVQGQKLWETTVPAGGKIGRLIFDARGSIFFPGSASIQGIKLNGSSSWGFNVYQGSSNSDTLLTTGPGNLLYLPLSSGLYALDTEGNYKWMMHWDSKDAYNTLNDNGREILACTGNSQAAYVVTGKKGEDRKLLAVSGEGCILWQYALGEIKVASLATGLDGRLYVTVDPDKNDRLKRWKILAFDKHGGKPAWSYPVECKQLTALTISGHGLIYFCADNRLIVLNQANGTETLNKTFNKVLTQPVVDENSRRVYLGADDKRLLAVNSQRRLDWELTLDGKVACPILTAPGGVLYLMTDKGSFYKIKDE